MKINTSEVQLELKDACQRVAVDSSIRAELLDVVGTEFIKYKDDCDPEVAVQKALKAQNTQNIFDKLDIKNFSVGLEDNLTINLDRVFRKNDFNPDIVLNGQMCVMGRVASEVAELALDGNKVALLNAKDIVRTGNKNTVIKNYRDRMELESDSGPYFPSQPHKIVKRSVRGMLPYKKNRGRSAYNRIRVYIATPDEFDGEAKIPDGKRVALNPQKKKDYVTIGEVSESLGAEVRW